VSIRVLLADDQAMVRAGFRMILESDPEIEVVGEAANGEQAMASTRRLRPDIVLMDIQMPDGDGLEATRRITEDGELHSRVVILTTFERDEYVFEALRSGASGFLLKNAPPEELLHAVHVVSSVAFHGSADVPHHERSLEHSRELARRDPDNELGPELLDYRPGTEREHLPNRRDHRRRRLVDRLQDRLAQPQRQRPAAGLQERRRAPVGLEQPANLLQLLDGVRIRPFGGRLHRDRELTA
jgi:DNA-binding NarL/FixJ family response regulator